MTKETAWNHLPNAVHIDRIVASVKAHPEEWYAAKYAAGSAAWVAGWYAAGDAAWDAALDAALDATWGAGWYAAGGAIAALVAWDHSSKWLDMTSDRLKVWHILSEDPACILLLPAVTAFEKIKEMEVV